MKHRVIAFALLMCALLAAPASAKTIEVKSENFIFVGDVSKSSAVELVEDLEEYRGIILALLNFDAAPELMPVRIYSVRSTKNVKALTGSEAAAGVYTTTVEGPVFILNAKGGFKRGKRARKVAFHEYTHHLMATYMDHTYPRWFDEGFADYLSTFSVDKDNEIRVGLPNNDHAFSLQHGKWLPIEYILSAIRGYPYPNDDSKNTQALRRMFYAQSWLAVHYIQSTKGYPQKLATYIGLLNARNTPKDAFEQAFGHGQLEFKQRLQNYHRKNRFLNVGVVLKEDFEIAPFKVREISKSEAAFHHGEATRLFRNHKQGRAAAREFYGKALKTTPKDMAEDMANIIAGQAALASRDGDHEQATRLIQDALLKAPNSGFVNRLAGMIWLNKNDHDKAPIAEEIATARKHLKKAMRLENDDLAAHFYYVQTYMVAQDSPSGQSVASAKAGLSYYRSVRFVDSNVDFAEVLIKAGEPKEAERALHKAVAWSRKRSVRSYARRALRDLP